MNSHEQQQEHLCLISPAKASPETYSQSKPENVGRHLLWCCPPGPWCLSIAQTSDLYKTVSSVLQLQGKGIVPSLPPGYSHQLLGVFFFREYLRFFLSLFLPFFASFCLPSFLPSSLLFLSLFSNFSNRWGLPLLSCHLIRAVRISCIHPGFSPGKSVRELAHFSRCQIGGWIQVWWEARGLFSSHGVPTKACARDRWGGDNVACRRAKHCSWHLSPHHTTALGCVTGFAAWGVYCRDCREGGLCVLQ